MNKILIPIIGLMLGFPAISTSAADGEEPGEIYPQNNLGPQNNLAPQNDLLREDAAPREPISRRQASDLARDRFAGRVLSVEMDDRDRWRVRIDENGTVFNVFVDSSSGEISRSYE